MVYDAKAVEVMIASPSDVVSERQIVREVISSWNAARSRKDAVCLMPVEWETHSSPELAGRPQQIINERVLEDADILVGIFWTRVGTHTGESLSGSVEEIERHMASNKPVMLYFSTAPVAPGNLDPDQYSALGEFRDWASKRGLIQFYENTEDFRSKFREQLQIMLNANEYLLGISQDAADLVAIFNDAKRVDDASISEDAERMLVAASSRDRGMIMIRRHLGGTAVTAGDQALADQRDLRSVARWVAAAEELYDQGLTRDINGKGEIFELTHSGFTWADKIKQKSASIDI